MSKAEEVEYQKEYHAETSTYYMTIGGDIVKKPKELSRIIGKVELLHTPNGTVALNLLKTGKFNISPYGAVLKDENGNIAHFNLEGFTIEPK